jgi:hypothetical protein
MKENDINFPSDPSQAASFYLSVIDAAGQSAAQVIVCAPKTTSGLSQFLLDQIV